MRQLIGAIALAAVVAGLAQVSVTQEPAVPPADQQGLSIRQRGDMIFKALATQPADAELLKQALADVGHVQLSFRSKPLRQWVEGAAVVEGKIVMTPTVALNRPSRGPAPEDWIDRLTAPVKQGYSPAELKLAPAPADEIRRQRDQIIAQADAKLRTGLLGLAAKYPQLAKTNWGTIVDALDGKSPDGRLVIWIGHYRDDKSGTREPVAKEDSYNVLALLRPLEWPEPAGHWALNPMYPNLALMGQVVASAGDPYLDAAVKKLLADTLTAPLEVLDDVAGGRRPANRPASGPGD